MNLEALLHHVKKNKTRIIVVTGGVCSSIGKGVLISSIGVLIKDSGASVSVLKFDPYLNVDPGTMSPLVHGEVFVTQDGAETDLDLGHYERMIGTALSKNSSVSSGQIFKEILQGEREGQFLGKCIQLVPHVVDAIKQRILHLAYTTCADYILVEIGGTVGDIEGEVFLEAIRQLRMDVTNSYMMHCHLSYVPYLSWAHEVKTKPTQHSVMMLKKAGLFPDFLFLRTDVELSSEVVKKLSLMCGIRSDCIFQNKTHAPIYQLFLDLRDQQLSLKLQEYFGVTTQKVVLQKWEQLIATIKKQKKSVRIGCIVKYMGTNEPYISVIEAIKSAAYACDREPIITYISANALEDSNNSLEKQQALHLLSQVHGIVVPGGFDKRGMEGKIVAARYAREHGVPYLGLCLGLQLLLVEIARSLLQLPDASSMELNANTTNPIIALLDEQNHIMAKGGTMRLGTYCCALTPGSKAHQAYGKDEVFERHRHRYEFNNTYRKSMEEVGVLFSGINPERNLVEIAELKDHPFMVGTQAHPEFISSPLTPHPLFLAFLHACIKQETL